LTFGRELFDFVLSQFVSSPISNTSSLSPSGGSSVIGIVFSADDSNCLTSVCGDSCRHVLKAEPAKP
jgi:hypothetical protein